MKAVLLKVKAAAGSSLEFSMFRLSVFTSLICGLGIVNPGPHLHQFILPCENTAAFHHLTNPQMCEINDDYANSCIVNGITGTKRGQLVNETDFDLTMKAISSEMGHRIYRRSYIEILLCESRPGRVLDKKDVFKRGQCIFHLSDDGIPMMKPYGYHGAWIPIRPMNRKFKLVNKY